MGRFQRNDQFCFEFLRRTSGGCKLHFYSLIDNRQRNFATRDFDYSHFGKFAEARDSSLLRLAFRRPGNIFLGIVFIATPSRRRRAHMLMLIGVFSLLLIPGCGGGSSSGGSTPPPPPVPTPSGSYPMTVTATSGSLSHQVSFTLTVQ
jgi:hypothetical protein